MAARTQGGTAEGCSSLTAGLVFEPRWPRWEVNEGGERAECWRADMCRPRVQAPPPCSRGPNVSDLRNGVKYGLRLWPSPGGTAVSYLRRS